MAWSSIRARRRRSLSSAEQALFAIVRAVEDLGRVLGAAARLLDPRRADAVSAARRRRSVVSLGPRVVVEGASVVFVSHDIAEVMEITDRATILRDGVLAGVLETRRASATTVRRARSSAARSSRFTFTRSARAARAPAARIEDLVAPGLGPVSFEVGKGEIVGLDRPDRLGLRPRLRRPVRRNARLRAAAWRSRSGREIPSRTPIRTARRWQRRRLPAGRPAGRGAASARCRCVENVMLPVLEQMRGRFGLDKARMTRRRANSARRYDVQAQCADPAAGGAVRRQPAEGADRQMAADQAEADPARRADAGRRRRRAPAGLRGAGRGRLEGAGSSSPPPISSNSRRSATACSCSRAARSSTELTGANVTRRPSPNAATIR